MKENIFSMFCLVVTIVCLGVCVNMMVTNKENSDRLIDNVGRQIIDTESSLNNNELMKYVGCELSGLDIKSIIDTYADYQFNLNIKLNEDTFRYTIVNSKQNSREVYRKFIYFLSRYTYVDETSTELNTSVIWYEDDYNRNWVQLTDCTTDNNADNDIEKGTINEITNQLPDYVSKLLQQKSEENNTVYTATKIEENSVKDATSIQSEYDTSLGINGEIIEDIIFRPTFKYRAYPLYSSNNKWVIGLSFDLTN